MFNNIPYIFLIKKSFHYIGEYKSRYRTHIVLTIIANFLFLLQPYLFGKILNAIQIGGTDMMTEIIHYLGWMVIAQIGWWGAHHTARYNEQISALGASLNYKRDIYGKLLDLPLEWHNNTHSGVVINQINKVANSILDFMKSHFRCIEIVIKGIGSMLIVLRTFPVYGVISVLVGAIIVFSSIHFDIKRIPIYKDFLNKENKFAGAIYDYISNISTVIILKVGKLTQQEIYTRSEAIKEPHELRIRLSEIKRLLNYIISFAVKVAIIFSYCYFTFKEGGIVLAGTLAMIYQYLQNMETTFSQFNDQNSVLMTYKTGIQNAEYIIQDYQSLGYKHLPNNHSKEDLKEITFKDISYNYPNAYNFSLQIPDLTLKKGQKIAFVGESGHGKTTFMKLIRGLYKPQSGELLLNGKPIGWEYMMDISMLIPQEPEIFENTLLYNITFGMNADENEVMSSIKHASFEKVLQKMLHGLESHINEKGVNLSGGEKQRLALARGIFASKESQIVLLDEPTSSVDPVNERYIYENLISLYKDKIMISSIHKFNLLDLFDYIYVFEKGTIVEQGTLNELMDQQGLFFSMFQKQNTV